jgi:16S rRNA (adenine1518-N6/adenine1519-N6)-dimethyltransferase
LAGRRLGQHFLIREGVLARLAEAACREREPLVIEIGPGRGALTRFLLERAGRVLALEIDPGLAAELRQRFPGEERLEVLEADVLETSLAQWGPAVVAGNLPYYITAPILERICGMGPLLKRAVVLVQEEVAQRLTALPGSRAYGFLTVRTLLFTQPELLFTVPPGAFHPPPKVRSAAVRLTPRAAGEDPGTLLEFASRCFRQKRKTLRNNLAPYYGRRIERQPEAGLRAEQLSLEQLQALRARLEDSG